MKIRKIRPNDSVKIANQKANKGTVGMILYKTDDRWAIILDDGTAAFLREGQIIIWPYFGPQRYDN